MARSACVNDIQRNADRNRLAVLMYHGVVEQPLSPFCWHQLDVGAFERQVEGRPPPAR